MNRPNILLITSDQQHWMTLGVQNPRIRTPNLDRLAAAGTLFRRAYCPNPTCTPTRASIITGQYPSQHGAWTLGTKLPESAHCVGDDFHAAGYHTALIGKAHFQPLASTEEYPSLEAYPVLQDLDFWRGFDQPFYGFRQVDLAPSFLAACGLPIPHSMSGRDQFAAWCGDATAYRDHAICEHHHNPTTVHLKTFVERRWKITVYYDHNYGELYDLETDPQERHNLWQDLAHAGIKSDLLLRFLHAEMGKEIMWMPRVAGA
jgi:arylsulfatase A-like enzyme